MEQHSDPTPPTSKFKRKLGAWDVSDIKGCANARVDGALTEFSPVKDSKKKPHVGGIKPINIAELPQSTS